MNDNQLFREEILDKNRREILPIFKEFFLKKENNHWYLTWWTNLALQYGHRKSDDFDFFTWESFDPVALANNFSILLKNEDIIVTHQASDTLYLLVNWIKVSFIQYDYPLIKPLIKTEYFPLASKLDVWCMKFQAIQWKATQKDYVDIYFLLKDIWFEKIHEAYNKKYPATIQDSLLLKYLLYTDDIEQSSLIFTDKTLSWENIIVWINDTVKKYVN